MKLTIAAMYKALVEKDSQYDGIFFAGVKTTGIFCRPVCSAKKPKFENVEFFLTTKEALFAGYRPCKLCHPLELYDENPVYIKNLIDEVENNPMNRITDDDLVKKGLDPSAIRRWFKKNHHMTFHAYQRAIRIGIAFGRIKLGEKVIDSAFNQGYDSLSGFTAAFKKQYGVSPKNMVEKNVITLTRISTPLGLMIACATEDGICLLEFSDRKMIEKEFIDIKNKLNSVIIPGNSRYFDLVNQELALYFEGKLKNFSVKIIAPGTDFQQKVWEGLKQIPYGETRSYKEQANTLGIPQAVRAVGRANGENRIAILIPCHRVIGEDGKMVGYGGGIWRKEFLLKLEKKYRDNTFTNL